MAIESVARGADPDRQTGEPELIAAVTGHSRRASGNPHAIAVSILADGINAMHGRRMETGVASSEQALTILRDQCVGLTWEMNMAQNLVIWALMYLGELGEVSRRVPALLADARSRGNLYLATELCTRSNYAWLAADEPDEGERETIESIARWSHNGFHRQHYSAMLARVQTALYRGDAEAGVAVARRTGTDVSPFVPDARPGLSNRGALPASAVRAGAAAARTAIPADSCPWPATRRSTHRQRANAVVRSDCVAASRRRCASRGQDSTRPAPPSRRRRSIRARRHEAVPRRHQASNRRVAGRRARARASRARPSNGWPRRTSRTPRR